MEASAEAVVRLATSVGILLVMAVWELVAPVRELTASKPIRWIRNILIAVGNTLVVRLVAPAGAVGVAWYAGVRGWGLFNRVEAPELVAIVVSIVVLDFVIYAQHVVFHKVPMLWRLHMVHHSDVDVDVTTGQRFHPVEIVLSIGIKALVVIALGTPAFSVLLFEIILNGTALFNHSNAKIPTGVDRLLRLVIVTPDMHRVHHSVRRREHDSNYGFNVPWWDRLLGTYRAQPEGGHQGMRLGLKNFPDWKKQNLLWFLSAPASQSTGRGRQEDDD